MGTRRAFDPDWMRPLLIASGVCLAACASRAVNPVARKPGAEHAGAPTTPASARPRDFATPAAPAVPPPGPFAPRGPSAARYGGPSPEPRPRDALEQRTLAALVEAARGLGRQAPQADERLFRAARDLAASGHPPTSELVSFLLSHHGVVEPDPFVTQVSTAPHGEEGLLDHMRPRFRQDLSTTRWTRVGLGVHRDGQAIRLAILYQETTLDADPFPRRLSARETATFSGRVPAGYGNPQVVLTTPDGKVGRIAMKRAAARAFGADLRCEFGPGRYQVELLADGAEGPRVLANFPLFCGVEAPAAITLQAQAPEDESASAAEVEETLFDAVNAERRRVKLPVLVRDDRLAEVARAHSRQMAAERVVAHVIPSTGDAAARMKAAGLRWGRLAENVGGATRSAEIHEGLMGSPGHRANIVDPKLARLGIGVVRGLAAEGVAIWYVTQVFTAP
jgi:uncharacterized protein YkwD